MLFTKEYPNWRYKIDEECKLRFKYSLISENFDIKTWSAILRELIWLAGLPEIPPPTVVLDILMDEGLLPQD